MDEWWKRHRNIHLAGYKESEVEDVTGCIPLLLDKCVAGGKVDFAVDDLHRIYDKAVKFVLEMKENTNGHLSKWQWYV
jgi:hypothetical protein